jgi:hypothetical protein
MDSPHHVGSEQARRERSHLTFHEKYVPDAAIVERDSMLLPINRSNMVGAR